MQKPETQKKRRTTLLKKISRRLRLVSIGPLVGLAIISVLLLFISYRNSNEEFERTLLQQKRAEVVRFVGNVTNPLQTVIGGFEENQVPDYEGQEFLLRGLLGAHEDLLEVVYVHVDDAEILGKLSGDEHVRCSRADEEVLCGEGDRTFVMDVGYLGALESGSFIGDVRWENNIPSIKIGAAVKREIDDKIIGVIISQLELTSLQDLFEEAGFGESGSVYIVDGVGRVLAHSEGESLRGRDAQDSLGEVPSEGARSIRATVSGREAFTSGLAIDIQGETGLPTDGEPDWWLIAEWPLTTASFPFFDAFLPVYALALEFLMVGIVIVLVAQLIGIRFSRAIVEPIRTVQEGAIRIGRGDFSKRVVLNTNDELEDLGDALNEMATDLEQLQRVRVAETRAQALAVAIAKEHELEEEKDTLLATASHQFRTPVTALNWNIELLKRMKIPPEGKDLLMGLEVHAKNLATIASDLLNATAFGAGYRVEPDRALADVNRAVEEALERFAGQIREKQITVVKQLAEPPIMVRGSFAAIRIAMEHLVSNAILYSNDKGTITITLGISETGEAKIKVADEGIGIPEDEQKHLFNPFFRAKNAIVKKNVGTGLGLFIVNNIFTGHGGRVLVESKEGEGTTIRVYLPGVQAPPNAETQDPKLQDPNSK